MASGGWRAVRWWLLRRSPVWAKEGLSEQHVDDHEQGNLWRLHTGRARHLAEHAFGRTTLITCALSAPSYG